LKLTSKNKKYHVNKANYLLQIGCVSDKTSLQGLNFIFLKSLPDITFGHVKPKDTIYKAIHQSIWKIMEKSGLSNFKECRVSASVQGQEWLSHIDAMHSRFTLLLRLHGYMHFSYLYTQSHLLR